MKIEDFCFLQSFTVRFFSRFVSSFNSWNMILWVDTPSENGIFTVFVLILYTPLKSYVVKQPQEKWACDFHDDATTLSF